MSRDITQLHPKLQEKIAQLKALCVQQGINLGIADCMRDSAEQADCVTRRTSSVRYPNSMHGWGVAFDFFNNVKGDLYNENIMNRVGALGQSIGLEWGGGWVSPVDKPHFQLPDWGTGTATLKANYGTPDNFRATWGVYKASATQPKHANVGVYGANYSDAQKWKIVKDFESDFHQIFAKCNMNYLNVEGAQGIKGSNVTVAPGNRKSEQNWFVKEIKQDIGIGTTSVYELLPALNGNLRLTVDGPYAKDGTNVNIQEAHTDYRQDGQRFYIRQIADEYVNIINVATGKLLDVYNAGK